MTSLLLTVDFANRVLISKSELVIPEHWGHPSTWDEPDPAA